jgi:ATP-dependent exoDNAse (exonuclease V) beta subunit
MVGDEFQSIYGFRHADVDIYRRQHRRFASGEEPDGVALPLTGNFRAAPEIVAATNAIGAALLDGFEPLTSISGEVTGPEPPVEMLLTVDDRRAWEAPETQLPRPLDDPSSGSKVAEARLLAGRLAELAAGGEDPAEMVVLLRAFTHVNTIERALSDAGLDPYVVGGRGFWSQQQIEDLRCLLAAIHNPLDDEPLLGALASPACGVLPDTLWLLRRTARRPREEGRDQLLHLWPAVRDLAERGEPAEGDAEMAALIPDDERERLADFANELTALRATGTEGGLEGLVERTATVFGYDLATLMREDGESRWSNVRKLMRLAREFEAREGPDLSAFLEYLQTSTARRDREAEAAARAEGHAGVRVMTVHSAKGLEFGLVAVADLGRSLNLGWSPLRVEPAESTPDGTEAARVGVQLGRVGRPAERLHHYEELTELAAKREAEEEGRLGYVAATRAKRRLILSGTFNPKRLDEEPIRRKPIATQLIRSLLGGQVEEGAVDLPAAAEGLPAGTLALRVSEPGPNVGASLLTPAAPPPEPEQAPEAEAPLRRPPTPPALSGGLSYSALSEYSRCGYRFYVERVLGIAEPDAAEPAGGEGEAAEEPIAAGARGRGVAVHELLERSAAAGWRPLSEERVRAALAEQGLDPTDELVERALGMVRGFLDSPLAAELDGARASPEAPFVLGLGGTLVRGSIDLLVERPDGSVLVIDYKTDRLGGSEPSELAERYRVQRDLYALAARARGAPVETVYVFLERPADPVRTTFSDEQLEGAQAGVEELLGELRSGSFEVTRHPHLRLCHDCPAGERLCSHAAEARFRVESEPAVEPAGPARRGPAQAADSAREQAQLTLLD